MKMGLSGVRSYANLWAKLQWKGKQTSFTPEQLPLRTTEIYRGKSGNRELSSFGPNKLIWGNNKYVLASLLKDYREAIDLIYLDPPFGTGDSYKQKTSLGSVNEDASEAEIETEAYCDRWDQGPETFLQMLFERLVLMKELLSTRGSIFVHLDYRTSHYVKVMLDEIFGRECFRNEIIWCFRQGGRSRNNFSPKHHTIFWYSKTKEWIFHADAVRVPYQGTGGYQTSGKGVRNKKTGKVYKPHKGGKIPEDWWDIPAIPPMSAERCNYPTQKPLALIRRIVQACSDPDSLVADFFCGSGTTLVAAEEEGRPWIGCDTGKLAIHHTRKRILKISRYCPFEIIELERYRDLGESIFRGKLLPDARLRVEGRKVWVEWDIGSLSQGDMKAQNWANYIDYWSVDWDYRDGVFDHCWFSFRNRGRVSLKSKSPVHTYCHPGVYRVLVKAVDIEGNSKDVELRAELE